MRRPSIQEQRDDLQNPRHAHITLLMIASPFRSMGIGHEVVNRIEAEILKNARIQAIHSAVQVNSPAAVRFWQRHGYLIAGGPEPQPDQTTVFRLPKDVRDPGF